ncbi:conserved hypothetical protein [Ricinus communis]|uniref:2S albumin n=1 Tax=Ricinus communis TaxID=3988 RepID=B9SA31_RICCO|nr:conserved hypothetical protein [Ricinus communis]|eukprot:XP_025013799.1 2S albumin [Ricinus communis]
MAKLAPTAALVSVLLVIIACTNATSTVEVDETNQSRTGIWSPSEKCRQELEGKDLSACLTFVAQSSWRRSTDKEVLEMPGEINQQERQQLRESCNEVEPVREDCQCEGLQAIVAEWLEQVRPWQLEDYYRVIIRASRISFSCDMRAQCLAQTFLS